MRRFAAAFCLLALAVPAAPATASHAPARVAATAEMIVIGQANTAIDVTIPKGASLLAVAPGLPTSMFAGLGSGDGWAAVALVSRTTKVAGKPVNAVQVQLPMPDNCPSTFAPTVEPVPPCQAFAAHSFVHGSTPRVDGLLARYPLPAGTYQFVVSGPRGTLVAAWLRFEGVRRGRSVATTSRPVTATLERARVAEFALAQTVGTFKTTLRRTGLGVVGAWHTAAGQEPGPFSWAHCVTPGTTPGPANPDDCAAYPATGQAPPAALGPKPAYAARADEPVTAYPSGVATAQTPLLKPGTYTDSFRVTRAGRGPAVGAFAWWLQSDALK